ncbi:Multidrug resistance-associated protein 1 [Boothiomyces macroporosus]|uniref:Multidrug resistance-associated protein 1 n=1 Tax=Boothiomyces macroporosus TaxID=261099 RepID=A0AAD5Y6L8_9FUNG|nr:Multidrug resistance-associated protein 1 [Boothiomyces macroporosus]
MLEFKEAITILSDYLSSEEKAPLVQREYREDVAVKTIDAKWKWFDADYVKKMHERKMNALRHGKRQKVDSSDLAENKDTFALGSVNIEVKKGSLVGIVGAAGSGKSTLFNGLVNELAAESGEQPWIMMSTIESNIAFGRPSDKKRLVECIQACGLAKDLNEFEHGMYTNVGESGINLSGGQKARVSLARCLYADADIYLLDDPLAALDAYVGKHVFEQVIKKELRDKTVLLATHQLQYMQQTDQIIVLENGGVAESGTFAELMSNPDGIFSRMMSGYHYDEEASESAATVAANDALRVVEAPKTKAADIVKKEKKHEGKIRLEVYKTLFTVVVMGYLLNFALEFAGLVILTAWASDTSNSSSQSMFYIELLSASAIGRVFVNYILSVVWFNGGLANSRFYFQQMAASVLRSPLYFFEENPIGRILNRFSRDLSDLNTLMYADLYFLTTYGLSVVGKSVLICVSNKIVIVILVAVLITISLMQKKFDRANLECTRLYKLSESPQTSLIAEALSGSLAINLLQCDSFFKEMFYKYCDNYISMFNMYDTNINFFELRVNLLNGLVTSAIVLLSIVFNEHNTAFSALVGLALSQSDSTSKDLTMFLNYITFNKGNMNSLERIVEYSFEIDQEAADSTPDDEKITVWPSNGSVEIKNLDIAYHSKPEVNVIKNLNVSIQSGERVGVVGRTGSGKSTIASAFFRLVEAKAGAILIDGVDISTVGLSKLRHGIQMISQEANLFTGSVRFNLTLDADIPDEELWLALDKAGLKDYISQLPERLDYQLLANGSNLSVGQGQLLCLARAIAHKPKVLILDEASSSVDGEADRMIQKVLKDELNGSTVISIAHRLNTVADFDKIMVLEKGVLVEFDSPHALLENPDSLFSNLVEATGEENSLAIKECAKNSGQKYK